MYGSSHRRGVFLRYAGEVCLPASITSCRTDPAALYVTEDSADSSPRDKSQINADWSTNQEVCHV